MEAVLTTKLTVQLGWQFLLIRNFHQNDVPSLVELENRLRQEQGNTSSATERSLREYLGQPNLRVDENSFLYLVEGKPIGFALLCIEPPLKRSVLELKIHPDYVEQNVERVLIKTALQKATDLDAKVLHFQTRQNPFLENLLTAEGFSPVRLYWIMQWIPDNVPSVIIPDGFSLRSYQGIEDAKKLMFIQNSSFDGTWGFSPNTVEEIIYRTEMSITSPEGIIFLCDGKTIAGYCWTFILERSSSKIGVISMIGIDPAYRHRRLGRPLLQAGLKYLHCRGVSHVELEVDSQNVPAVGLYKWMGFEKVMECQWFGVSLETSVSQR